MDGFSSTHKTSACSGGFRYSPPMSAAFGPNSGSVLIHQLNSAAAVSKCRACAKHARRDRHSRLREPPPAVRQTTSRSLRAAVRPTTSALVFPLSCHNASVGPSGQHPASRPTAVRRSVAATSKHGRAWSAIAARSPGWTFLGWPRVSPWPVPPSGIHLYRRVPTAGGSVLLQRSKKLSLAGPRSNHSTIRLFVQLDISLGHESGVKSRVLGLKRFEPADLAEHLIDQVA